MFNLWDDESTKRKKIPKGVRASVWKKYMGSKYEGPCYCCGIETISSLNFEVGHNKAVAKGGSDSIDNLRPICKNCNSSMGTKSIESYKKKHYTPESERKKESNLKPSLESLTVPQLKSLAEKHYIKVKGSIVEDFLDSHRAPPTKRQYIKQLSRLLTEKELRNINNQALKEAGRKKRKG